MTNVTVKRDLLRNKCIADLVKLRKELSDTDNLAEENYNEIQKEIEWKQFIVNKYILKEHSNWEWDFANERLVLN